MIDQQRITKEWVEGVSESNGGLDKTLIEKAVRALMLVISLKKSQTLNLFWILLYALWLLKWNIGELRI